ncbi:polysaccharide lyase family 7 protein [Isoptericola jiangsuensis]|uniref:polysaccharide lyase family 7 protein n=1 Tax=Isoptericola jiangsuensis TaxID=548579 RepID=UPI003AAF261C
MLTFDRKRRGISAAVLALTTFVSGHIPGLGVTAEATPVAEAKPAAVTAAAPAAAATAADSCDYPAQKIDLTNWKVTLPTGTGTSPTEILQPELDTFSVDPWFQVNSKCTGIQFRSAVNGVTTSGSGYPRSELREMTADGTERAAWDATTGKHTMVFREAFNHLPEDKPHLVGAQIHDGDDDVTVFRLEGTSLYITKGNDTHHKLVTDNYKLHTVFEGKFVVKNGKIKVYYNGKLQTTIKHTASGNYFKAGAYTQANCNNSSPCDSSNYGQTSLYQLQVTHTGTGTTPTEPPVEPTEEPTEPPVEPTEEPTEPPVEPTEEPTEPAAGCDYPAEQLDLTDWKITLPTGSGTSPTEILQPDLATFSTDTWFQVNDECDGVQFRAAVNGVTTSGSGYPRSELREMTDGGSEKAAWDATSGTHTLVVRESFDHLPEVKPHLVGAQIHDSDDDVTVFRLEGTSLYVTKGNDTHHHLITDDYQLGTEFEAKFVVADGEIKAYYNGELQTTIPHTSSGNYFKAGAYTQANCGNSSPCDSSNYGQTTVYDLEVTHS